MVSKFIYSSLLRRKTLRTWMIPLIFCSHYVLFLCIALQKAISYIERDELPPHWDKEIIFAMDEPTTSTESSESASERSEDGEDEDSEEDEQTTEEKDHLVAELYKHMEDKGSPINHTPAINGQGKIFEYFISSSFAFSLNVHF